MSAVSGVERRARDHLRWAYDGLLHAQTMEHAAYEARAWDSWTQWRVMHAERRMELAALVYIIAGRPRG